MLILASRSPRRQELLRATGLSFRVAPPSSEDRVSPHTKRYAALVRRTALAKAQEVASRESGLVLAADTIVVCAGEVMGKPKTATEAKRMLRKLSGRWHHVYTGVALVKNNCALVDYERTEVAFRVLSKQQIDWYVGTGEPMDKAGSYAIQGKGAALVRIIRGCYTNVIGLPLPKVLGMLAEFALLEKSAGQTRGSDR